MGILALYKDEFFESSDINARPLPGDIYYVPIAETQEVPRVLEVDRNRQTGHQAVQFVQKDVDLNRHFKEERELPVANLRLSHGEEYIGLKAKLRPVVILEEAVVNNLDFVKDTGQRRKANHLTKSSFLVAPFYSPTSALKSTCFSPELVAEIRRMQYPQFFCLPMDTDGEQPGSIIRLDRTSWHFLGKGTRKRNIRLQDEVFQILRQQHQFLVGAGEQEAYSLAREVAMEAEIIE